MIRLNSRLSRRALVLQVGILVPTVLVAACSGSSGGSAAPTSSSSTTSNAAAPTAASATSSPAAAPTAAAAATTAPAAQASTGSAAATGQLEIFSWWTGSDGVALAALYKLYNQQYPNVKIVNAALGGGTGPGGNMKAVLKTRILGGDPPDSFQVHLGAELIDTWVTTNYMEPLDDLFKQEGYADVFPKRLIDIASWHGHPWSVPFNAQRVNIMFYNKSVLAKNGIKPPATFADFFQACKTLKEAGVIPLALGDNPPGASGRVLESVLIGALGPDDYDGLWTGKTPFSDGKVTDALNYFKELLSYVNSDYLSIGSTQPDTMVAKGQAAMLQFTGDWTDGTFKGMKFTDWGAVPPPNNANIWDLSCDSFGLPKKAKHRQNAINWLILGGSKKGQDTFDSLKGAISPRSDSDPNAGYDAFQKQEMVDFHKFTIVPAVVDGAAISESWTTDFVNDANIFATKKDVASAQKLLAQACVSANVCK